MPIVLALLVLAAAILTPFSAVEAASPSADVAAVKPKPSANTKPKQKAKKPRPATKEKKGHDNVSTPNRGTVDPIGTATRGHLVKIHGTALRNGETCTLRLFYEDGQSDTISDVVPNKRKRCTFGVTIPDRPGVVGTAKVVMTFIKATSGKQNGTARQVFTIS